MTESQRPTDSRVLPSCCPGTACAFEKEGEPCRGKITAVDEEYTDDDYWWIHACTGHAPVSGGFPYKSQPK